MALLRQLGPAGVVGPAEKKWTMQSTHRHLIVALGCALVLVTAVANASAAKPHTVTVAGGPYALLWRFDPSEVTVAVGDKVRWSNPSSATHHVTAYDGPWDGTSLHLDPGGKTTFRFKKPGIYLYRCDISTHSEVVEGRCIGQCGTIVVE